MSLSVAVPWNEGEKTLHRLLNSPRGDNPTVTVLTPQASYMLQQGPLLALGTLDAQSRPWATLWGGTSGFSEPLGHSFVGTRTLVDAINDPVVQALVGDAPPGETLQPANGGKLLAGLALDLMNRKRVKVAGKMVAGTVTKVEVEGEDQVSTTQDQIQLVTKIDQSLGNCPKYLNQYEIRPAIVKQSKLIHMGQELSDEGQAQIAKSDMFFMSTSTDIDQDVNHRGGPAGFVRIISPTQIIYPEYSGNRFYQSLGNLRVNPKIGMVFPDFENGNVLYLTGTANILIGKDAAEILPRSNLAVQVTIDESRYVTAGLPFRGKRHSPSPYNPQIRTLASEGNIRASLGSNQETARLTQKTIITPTLARFTFSMPKSVEYKPGQWVAMDLKKDLDIGYAHMNDDDPTSLNDDFVRTFTISSAPASDGAKDKTFDITIRKVGPVTDFLFRQNERAEYELSIVGIGGDFNIKQSEIGVTPFIAGGVGITPLLGQLHLLDISRNRFKLFWTLRFDDIDLVQDILQQYPELAECTEVYFTGEKPSGDIDAKIEQLTSSGVDIKTRRLTKSDFDAIDAQDWYLCAAKSLRKSILLWLEGKNVIFEAFDF